MAGRPVVTRGRGGPSSAAQAGRVQSPGSVSAYGSERGFGYNPTNPQAYLASVGAKSYKSDKGTADWDGPGISPPLR